MKDQAVNYWKLWPDLMSNFVIQLALTALGAGLIGWITYNLRAGRRSTRHIARRSRGNAAPSASAGNRRRRAPTH
jgi:hypothetical protein